MATTTLPSFQIEVEAANRPPVISGSPATSIVEGQAYSFVPTASDPDGDTLTFTVTNRPSWAAFSTTTGRLSGTPGAGTVGNYPNIQIRVSDGSLQASLATFSIEVQQSANGTATLSWTPPTTRTDGSPLTNLAGFRVRYGNSVGNYPNTITIPNPGVTTYRGGEPGAGHLLLRDRGLRLDRQRKLEHQPAFDNHPVRASLQAARQAMRLAGDFTVCCGGAGRSRSA